MDLSKEKSLLTFTDDLASSAPAPGGGGAAALLGALGASLCSMVANLTIGKAKYADVQDEMHETVTVCLQLKNDLLDLIDKDEECFLPLSKAYSIPKTDPDRDKKLCEASLEACQASMEILRKSSEAVPLIEKMFRDGSKIMVSDAGCAALAAKAAMESAAMNVFVNTKGFRGNGKADALETEVSAILKEYLPRAEAVSSAVMKKLRGENA